MIIAIANMPDYDARLHQSFYRWIDHANEISICIKSQFIEILIHLTKNEKHVVCPSVLIVIMAKYSTQLVYITMK